LNLEPWIGVAILVLLIAGCLVVLRPFVSALLWATVLCFASWPVYRRLLALVRNHNTVAALLMCLGLVLLFLTPIIIVGVTLADNVNALNATVQKVIEEGPPAPPQWLGKIPVVGGKAVESWQNLAGDTGKLLAQLKERIPMVSGWLLRGGLKLGQGLLEMALSIFIAFFLFRDGVSIAEGLNTGMARVAGDRGVRLLAVAGKTVRGVVYGILGTALVQAVLAGIGFVVAGVPGAALLALMTFFSSVVPVVGTAIVWVPAALWLFDQGSTGWGIFMLIWGVAISSVDNVIKPWIISQGSAMPFLLIFFGVLGGAVMFGFIGVFIGPTLLAVGYRVVSEWAAASRPDAASGKAT
jgi:predicted PurR-regulated permease PerM